MRECILERFVWKSSWVVILRVVLFYFILRVVYKYSSTFSKITRSSRRERRVRWAKRTKFLGKFKKNFPKLFIILLFSATFLFRVPEHFCSGFGWLFLNFPECIYSLYKKRSKNGHFSDLKRTLSWAKFSGKISQFSWVVILSSLFYFILFWELFINKFILQLAKRSEPKIPWKVLFELSRMYIFFV